MGAPEHDEDSKLAAMDDPKAILDKARRVTDDVESDQEEGGLIEKAPEQIAQEREAAWKAFHYPAWCHYAVYLIFAFCMVNVVLTLTQYHGHHSSLVPVDYEPLDKRMGGWAKDEFRWAGAILGLIASCFSFVLSPSTSKFKFLFLILFVSSVMHFWSFGVDLFALNDAARDSEAICGSPDMVSRKFVCDQERYRATVIFDMLCGVFGIITSFFILHQATSGVVKKRKVFNEQTKTWEKIVLGPDEEYFKAFPKKYIKQRPLFNFAVMFCATLNIVSVVLSATQSTLDIYQAEGMESPIYNVGRRYPIDIWIIRTMEAIPGGLGNGSWPVTNFYVRLFTNLLALVASAFLIQWRRDGRKDQLVVMFMLTIAAVGYIWAFIIDASSLVDATENCSYAKPLNMACNFMQYEVTVAFDGLCVLSIVCFVLAAFRKWYKLAQPGRFERAYGWWCFGEWEHEKQVAAEQASME